MRCLVTGGSGFIGQHIVRALSDEGHEVVIFDVNKPDFSLEPNMRFVEGDVRYADNLLDAVHGVDEIYNVASLLGTSELMWDCTRAVDTNVNGMLNVLKIAVERGVKRVFYPTKPNEWLNTYSISKFAAERFCQMYAANFGLHVVSLKWFNAYGRRQKIYPVRKAIPTFIAQALRDVPIEIWGDGTQTVDLIHVEDIARIAIDVTRNDELPLNKVCDVGSGIAITVNQLAERIKRLTDSNSEIVHHDMRPGEPISSDIHADVTSLRRYVDLNLRDLDEGLSDTVDWYSTLADYQLDAALAYFESKRVLA